LRFLVTFLIPAERIFCHNGYVQTLGLESILIVIETKFFTLGRLTTVETVVQAVGGVACIVAPALAIGIICNRSARGAAAFALLKTVCGRTVDGIVCSASMQHAEKSSNHQHECSQFVY